MQIENSGGAPMGAAMIAGLGVGAFMNLPEAAAQWVRLGRRFTPDTSLATHYKQRAPRYEALLHALNDWHCSASK